jgi:uracil-DNA glycosylase
MIGYLPWEGANYAAGLFDRPRPTLLVAESHKGSDAESCNPMLTRWVIEDAAAGNGHVIFNRIAAAVGGDRAIVDPAWFWNSVAFMNFLDEPLKAQGDRPTPAQWQASLPIFQAKLDRLRPAPERIITFGRGTWDEMPPWSGPIFRFAPGRYGIAGPIRAGTGHAFGMATVHPTGSRRPWRPEHWRTLIACFVAAAELQSR